MQKSSSGPVRMLLCEIRDSRTFRYSATMIFRSLKGRARRAGVLISVSRDEGMKRWTPATMAASMRFVCSGTLVGC